MRVICLLLVLGVSNGLFNETIYDPARTLQPETYTKVSIELVNMPNVLWCRDSKPMNFKIVVLNNLTNNSLSWTARDLFHEFKVGGDCGAGVLVLFSVLPAHQFKFAIHMGQSVVGLMTNPFVDGPMAFEINQTLTEKGLDQAVILATIITTNRIWAAVREDDEMDKKFNCWA